MENETTNKDDSIDNLSLELGQVIKIYSPQNSILDNNYFYIYYIDRDKIKILNPTTQYNGVLNLEDGNFTDESIEGIEILMEPEQKGYARQNNLLLGNMITIEFGPPLPEIINGEITNLEEDMIEGPLWNK